MKASKDEILVVALGGAGEIGMNFYAYGHDNAWLAVDCGVSFGDPNMPGIDVFTADPSFLEEDETNLKGMVITHAHEDHIGGVAHLWPLLRCPIYVTPFAAEILKGKLRETDFADEVPIHILPAGGGTADIGPFSIEMVQMSHSIPEPQAIAITTAAGTVLHSGDWKIDPNPQIGDPIDEARLRELGDKGILALVGDSTNAMEDGHADSEAAAKAGLIEVISRQTGRVAVGCFATNVARVKSIAEAAKATGRSLVLAGRSLHRVSEAARKIGYLDGVPEPVAEDKMKDLDPDKVLMICTGSQGEDRAALARMARDDHHHVFLEKGDSVIFSSRVIPGNEREVGAIQNAFAKRGVNVLTESNLDETVHVTGHPMRDELTKLMSWTRPKFVLPVHGEWRHMEAHAELAEMNQVEKAVVGGNGAVIRVTKDSAEIVDTVYSGRLALDGDRLIDPNGPLLPQRRRLARGGVVGIAVALDQQGKLVGKVNVDAYGCVDKDVDGSIIADTRDAVAKSLKRLDKRRIKEDGSVEKSIVGCVKQTFGDITGKKPLVTVHIIRV